MNKSKLSHEMDKTILKLELNNLSLKLNHNDRRSMYISEVYVCLCAFACMHICVCVCVSCM